MSIRFVYEVTVEFTTDLFDRSSLTIGVESMSDVVDLQSPSRQVANAYRFASYRAIRVFDVEGVKSEIKREKAAQAEIARGI